ncbi:MAG: response regulator transcription factor [Ilumatobacter sp.]|uniref:response regulator transcription factor n=1 Tax=Ilumatobacter sp. TaxID=1967498 RepID=UPI0026368CF8|nr:response regulator transcription factor [Ilumatobacter sp.]MDJ0768759.1 response regulator transcription factor [Ilumatobacter sp.]
MRRVVIADDALLLRQGVTSVLTTLDGVEVVAEADDHPSLMAAVDEHRPDLVITDVRMPPTHTNEGIAAAREIRSRYPDTGVIVLSQYLDADYVIELLEDGTEGLGYLLKENVADRRQLASAIDAVCSSSSSIDAAAIEVFVQARSRRPSPFDDLTERERDVLSLVAEGLRNSAVAERLHLSEKSVEKHINSIFSKLHLSDEPESNRRVRSVLLWLAEH